MILTKNDYRKVLPLIENCNELSVLSVIEGKVSGEIYVDRLEEPTVALIKTSECNYVAGNSGAVDFYADIRQQLDFWDTITPDDAKWDPVVCEIHPNRFIKKYTRRRYVLKKEDFESAGAAELKLPDGYVAERVIPEKMRSCSLENADEVIEWMENFGSDDSFLRYGSGVYIRNDDEIVSWSLTDCATDKIAAIGIQTDENCRKSGFGKMAARENIRACFERGFKKIEWLCVDSNAGSIAIAEGLGFKLQNSYFSYAPYAPVENLADLTEDEWLVWAEHFENAAKEDDRYFDECIYTYVKANCPDQVQRLLAERKDKEALKQSVEGFANYLKGIGMASRF